MKEIILKVENLSVSLKGEEIIKNLSFEVKRGDVLTILGPNGAGKTVLLKTLLGIFPYYGKISWKKGVKIGYVPQRVPFFKIIPLSVEEFFSLKTKKRDELKFFLNQVKIKENYLKKRIAELSSGEFQRILIVWALLERPTVLLFDEPTVGVDILAKSSIYSLLKELKEKMDLTILLVTHDLSVVYKFSNYVICLNKISLCQGIPKNILTPAKLAKLYGEQVSFYSHIKI